MNKATQMKLLSRAVSGVVLQGRPARKAGSSTDQGTCQYRMNAAQFPAYDVLKCAAGQLISDAEYSETFEGDGITRPVMIAIYNSHPDLFDQSFPFDMSTKATNFFGALQRCHDDAPRDEGFIPTFLARTAELARRINAGEFETRINDLLERDYVLDLYDEVLAVAMDSPLGHELHAFLNTVKPLLAETCEDAMEELVLYIRKQTSAMWHAWMLENGKI